MRCKQSVLILSACILQYPFTILTTDFRNGTLTDLSKCKLTHLGTEYMGSIMATAGGIRCQSWHSEQPLHMVSPEIKDRNFPERSMIKAKNYCRNPTRDPRGPWCYTMEPTLIDDECNIPLCNYGECRITGPGAEYSGTHKRTTSGKKCKSWDKRYKLSDGKTTKFSGNLFADQSRIKAKDFCRNPDDSIGGPWCYVDEDDYELTSQEYCDIPFCDDRECLVYARNASVYSTITSLNNTLGNITLWIKLWNPYDQENGEGRLLLSLLPIPTSAKKIAQDWRTGVEIVISNSGSGQTFPSSSLDHEREKTPNILLGSKWTGLWVAWGGGFLSVGLDGSTKPLFLEEYKKRNTISSLYPDTFLYYGLMGTGVLWSTGFCKENCEVHTTFGMEFIRMWPLMSSNITYDLHFHVRASRKIAIRLYQNPGAPFPRYTIIIGEANTMSLTFEETETSKQHLKDAPSKGMLDYWSWKEFTLSFFGSDLRIFGQYVYGHDEVLYVNHKLLGTVRWFSAGSDGNVAHWAFYCDPKERDPVEEPWPPNCINSPTEYKYDGLQWTSANQHPCIPWASEEVPEDQRKDDLFVDTAVIKALNKCRNPLRDPEGPYCYSISSAVPFVVSKQTCSVRKCGSTECRMAGTANDYIGILSVTRSGLKCGNWISDYDILNMINKNKSMEVINSTEARAEEVKKLGYPPLKPMNPTDPAYFNDSLYPEHSIMNASNYCRNPSRNIFGTWCYTKDPWIPQDLCNVRDCEKPEECIFLVKGQGMGRRMFVLPEYRSEGLQFALKEWEPDHPDTITFVFTADDGLKSRYILKIGAQDNEQVHLYYESETEDLHLVKKKTLPHLLYMGKWSRFVLRIPRGVVEMYYEGGTHPLFSWNHPELEKAFLPIYYFYTSESGNAIAVSFDCHSRCHIEHTTTDKFTRILPLSIWKTEETPTPNRLELTIRAKGVVLVPLFLMYQTSGYYGLTIGELGQWIFFMRNTLPNVQIFHKQRAPGPLFTADTWTNITIRWYGGTIKVSCNETEVFHYEHRTALLFYFFSLAVDRGGWATWTANCLPIDIDGDAEDGGWSEWGPWACSVSCNGGIGTRKRLCNNPAPNVRGEPCLGPSTMSGRCNMNTCGDITEDTITMVRKRIRRNFTSLTVKEGNKITIPCDPDIIVPIKSESPKSHIRWTHNGLFVKEANDRFKIQDHDIVVNKAVLNDSGVYALTLHRVDGSHMIFKVVTLAVIPVKSIVKIRETLPFSVTCHCIVLGYVYTDLNVGWLIDGKTWKDYGITMPVVVNTDHIAAINKSHNGKWTCVVEQGDLDFKWTTNIIIVKVLGPPNWRTHLMEDRLTRPIFGKLPNESFVAIAALVIFIILTSCILVGFVGLLRFRESLKAEIANGGRVPRSSKTLIKEIFKKDAESPRQKLLKSDEENGVNGEPVQDEAKQLPAAESLKETEKEKVPSKSKIDTPTQKIASKDSNQTSRKIDESGDGKERRESEEKSVDKLRSVGVATSKDGLRGRKDAPWIRAQEKFKKLDGGSAERSRDGNESTRLKDKQIYDPPKRERRKHAEESGQSENANPPTRTSRGLPDEIRLTIKDVSSSQNESEYQKLIGKFKARIRSRPRKSDPRDGGNDYAGPKKSQLLERVRTREKARTLEHKRAAEPEENRKLILDTDTE